MFPEKIKSKLDRFAAQFLGSPGLQAEGRGSSLYWRCRNFRLLKAGFFPLSASLEMAAEYEQNWREAVAAHLLDHAESDEPVRSGRNFDFTLVPQLLAAGQRDEDALALANTRIELVCGRDTPPQIEHLLDKMDCMPEHGIFASATEEGALIAGVFRGYSGEVPLCAASMDDEKAVEAAAAVFSAIQGGSKSLKDAMLECMESICGLQSSGLKL